MIISNFQLPSLVEENLNYTQSYLDKIALEYGISNEELLSDKIPTTPITEGIIGTFIDIVKTIFRAAIKAVLWIWHKIVEFVRFIIGKIVEIFNKLRGKKENKKLQQPIVVTACVTEASQVKSTPVVDKDKIISIYKDAITSLSTEIRTKSQANISYLQQFERKTNIEISKYVREESFQPVDEKVVYNGDIHYDQSEIDLDELTSNPPHRTGATTNIYHRGFLDDGVDSIQGTNQVDHLMVHKLDTLKNKELYLVEASKDLVKAYNDFCLCKFRDLRNLFNKYADEHEAEENDPSVRVYTHNKLELQVEFQFFTHAERVYDDIKKFSMEDEVDEDKLDRYFTNNFFPTFEEYTNKTDKENAIRRWLRLKINYNKGISSALQDMVNLNYSLLGITLEQANLISGSIANEDRENGLMQLKKLFIEKSDLFVKYDLQVFDFRSIKLKNGKHLGCVCFSQPFVEDTEDGDSRHGERFKTWFNSEGLIDDLWSFITRYDVTIMGHGGKGIMIDYDSDPMRQEFWEIEPVITPSGKGPFEDANDLVHQLIKEGFKRINLCNCNPGDIELADDIKKNRHVIVRISHHSSWA